MYADDAIILSASVSGLRALLGQCYKTSQDLSLTFNCNKSVCICFGPNHSRTLPKMTLCNEPIIWYQSIKYLGI